MSNAEPFGLFECVGIELEYMIVDAETLDVSPIADRLLVDASGAIQNEIEHGALRYLDRIDALGGMVAAIEQGFVQREIQNAAYEFQKTVD